MQIVWGLIKAFLVGGALCVVGEALVLKTKLTPARIMVSYVVAGVILTAIGVYEPIVKYAGSGATVPIIGFGYSLANGAIDGAMNEGLLGAITGGVKAAAGGIAAAVLFGYAFALIFTPKTKK